MQPYNITKNRKFAHTKIFNHELQEKIGVDVDFANVWKTRGLD